MTVEVYRWGPVDVAGEGKLSSFFADVSGSLMIGEIPALEEIPKALLDPGLDIHDTVWNGDELVGYAALCKRDGTDVTRELSLTLLVRSDCRTASMQRGARRWLALARRRVLADLPPASSVKVYASTQRDDPWAPGLLKACGFQMERVFADMHVSLSTRAHGSEPEKSRRLVRFSTSFAEEVRIACNEAFDGHWGTTPWSPQVWHDEVIADPDFLPDLSFLMMASAADTVEAFVLTSDAMPKGQAGRTIHIDLIGTEKGSRGQGLATRLLNHTLRIAGTAGYEDATLTVDTDGGHGALAIYQRLGFVIAEESLHWCAVDPTFSTVPQE